MFTVALCLFVIGATSMSSVVDIDAEFDRFTIRYGRKYRSSKEWFERRAAFSTNLRRASEISRRNPLAQIGVTKFSDFTEKELSALLPPRPRRNSPPRTSDVQIPSTRMPPAVDWRATPGVVGPIKDQGNCGSCWAFSAIANIESQWALARNPHVSLSEQELVSCDPYDGGCNGGDTFSAWQWVTFLNKGVVPTEASLPYVSGGGDSPPCLNKTTVFGARIAGYVPLPQNETELAAWTAVNGPPSICLNADVLLHYQGGIITDCPNHQTDHCVLIVGFNTTHQPPYWIVRNSWGTSWGERGYFRLEMFHDLCGMLDEPGSSLITRPPPAKNATYFVCDAKCSKCDTPVVMEDGVCSDGGSGWSMTATCTTDNKVAVVQYSGPHCTGAILVNATIAAATCTTVRDTTFEIVCN